MSYCSLCVCGIRTKIWCRNRAYVHTIFKWQIGPVGERYTSKRLHQHMGFLMGFMGLATGNQLIDSYCPILHHLWLVNSFLER
jgi:hypothetical protein